MYTVCIQCTHLPYTPTVLVHTLHRLLLYMYTPYIQCYCTCTHLTYTATVHVHTTTVHVHNNLHTTTVHVHNLHTLLLYMNTFLLYMYSSMNLLKPTFSIPMYQI